MQPRSDLSQQFFPSVGRRTQSDKSIVAANHLKNSRRETMRNRKSATKNVTGNTANPTGATATDKEFEADVLFQRIYDKWYAFSVVDEDCLVTEVTEEEVKQRMTRKTPRAA